MFLPGGSFTRLLLALVCTLGLSACVAQHKLQPQEISRAAQPPSRDTTIALLGGTGLVGGHILQAALSRGYQLRVLSRSPQKLGYLDQRIAVVSGDARDPAVIAALLQGSDVVISAVGPGKGNPGENRGLTTTVSDNILQHMQGQGIKRYIVVSGAAVTAPGDSRSATGWLVRQLARLRYPALVQDRQSEFQLIADSAVDWTVVRCPLVESGPFQHEPIASLDSPDRFTLRAAELASFVLDQVSSKTYAGKAPFLYSRP